MNAKTLRTRLKPHLWYQAYWVVYLIWFFWLDLTITDPNTSSTPRWMTSFPSTSVHFSVLQLVRSAGGGHGPAVVVRYRQL